MTWSSAWTVPMPRPTSTSSTPAPAGVDPRPWTPRPEALWEWLLELRQQYPKARVGLCLEQPAVHLLPFLAEAFTAHPDHDLFASLPGAGPVLAPRLLASLGSHRERFASARELQQYRGVAPVTKKSGRTCYIHRRYQSGSAGSGCAAGSRTCGEEAK
jgi:hypothetical protein